jgi:tRNA1(Val) A37 N6-methylase TrmN6
MPLPPRISVAKRPAGWSPGGPQPLAEPWPEDCLPRDGEEVSFLTGDFRILQLQRGHRWSLDDLLTAWWAVAPLPPTASLRHLDMGCGIGSVLMSVAWALPESRSTGIEAQAISYGLLQRSLRLNALTERVTTHHGDLRETQLQERFDLITGTPPYFDIADGTVSDVAQRGPCRFETRGGIETYCEAAARHLAPGGRFVVCETALELQRVYDAAAAANLSVRAQLDIIPRAGKAPLIRLFEMVRGEEASGEPPTCATLTVRDEALRWTAAFTAVRARMGMPV